MPTARLRPGSHTCGLPLSTWCAPQMMAHARLAPLSAHVPRDGGSGSASHGGGRPHKRCVRTSGWHGEGRGGRGRDHAPP
ncbi:hypothetical protein F750_1904 [Streptomyces sp. PAMC 26508]|nr:hypothetical protein F750_1904 [Streptomyces sp. PAMC 26508]